MRSRTGIRFSLLGRAAHGLKRKRPACLAAAVTLSIIVLALAASRTTIAQSSNVPAVRVLRDSRLYQTMWPADFNGDGVTDLISSSRITYNVGVPTGANLQRHDRK